MLGAAVRLARLYAVATLVEHEEAVDVAHVLTVVRAIKTELDAVRALKTQLTSISTTSAAVGAGLDRLREAILARVSDAEAQLQAGVSAASLP